MQYAAFTGRPWSFAIPWIAVSSLQSTSKCRKLPRMSSIFCLTICTIIARRSDIRGRWPVQPRDACQSGSDEVFRTLLRAACSAVKDPRELHGPDSRSNCRTALSWSDDTVETNGQRRLWLFYGTRRAYAAFQSFSLWV